MKILIIHNRHYHVSSPETYLLNLIDKIESLGHSVDVFSLDYEKNLPSSCSSFFPNPIGSKSSYSFKNQNLSFVDKLKVVFSLFYRHDVYLKLNDLLCRNNYDGAVVLQFWGKLSPAIFRALNKNNVNTALRISDFGLICGTNTLLKDNKHSEECITNRYACIKNKCVNNSYARSFINKLAQINFNARYSSNIKYIFTCNNTLSIFKQAGFKKNLFHLPTFYPKNFVEKKSFNSNKIIYLGRVDEDKGLHNIIPLVPDTDELIFEIWGKGSIEYLSMLKKLASNRLNKNIKIKGVAEQSQIPKLFDDCLFSIIPSQWHDNLPNSLIESLSNGVPVIAPSHGCFSEFITHGKNGFLFNKIDDLSKIFTTIINLNNTKKKELSLNSTIYAKETFSSKIHVDKLIKIITRDNEKIT